MTIKLDKKYDVKTTLGTIREIEKTFKKGFFDIITDIASMQIDDQMRFLFAGVKKAGAEIDENKFIELCEDNIGIGELMEYIEQYIFALQYPGLSVEEVQQKLEKKLQSVETLQVQKK